MSPSKRYAKKQAKAGQRRRLQAHERLERDRRQAQRAAEALHRALEDLGLPEDLVVEIEGRLHSQHQLLGKIVGVMFPPLFGCRTSSELCRVRGWDKTGSHACLPSCPNGPGSSGCGASGRRCWGRCGAMYRPRARPRRAAGNGVGCSMTRYSKSMESSWGSWEPGGVGSTNAS